MSLRVLWWHKNLIYPLVDTVAALCQALRSVLNALKSELSNAPFTCWNHFPSNLCTGAGLSLEPGPGFSMKTLQCWKQRNSPAEWVLKQQWDNCCLGNNLPTLACPARQFPPSNFFSSHCSPLQTTFQCCLQCSVFSIHPPLLLSFCLWLLFEGLSHWPLRLCRVPSWFSRPPSAKPWTAWSDPRAGPALGKRLSQRSPEAPLT